MAQNSSKIMTWCRLWHDMPTDPKFRVVAKRSGRPTAEVVAVFIAMLTNASANEDQRGTLRGWCHEDVATALDMETEHTEAIYSAMQGRLLDGDRLTGWERRQPKRERDDDSKERVAACRERKRNVTPRNAINDDVTPRNALEERRVEEIRVEEISEEKNIQPASIEQVAAREQASGPSEIDGLNGSTQMIVEQFANWLSPYAPDFKTAHKSIADAVRLYGSSAVRDGFADLKAKHADGEVRALTTSAFYGFVKRAKERSASRKPDKPDRSNMVFKPSRYGPGKWVPKEAVAS